MQKPDNKMKRWLNSQTKDLKKINFNSLVNNFKDKFNVSINDARMYVMQWDHDKKNG
jgi:hypothetical protein